DRPQAELAAAQRRRLAAAAPVMRRLSLALLLLATAARADEVAPPPADSETPAPPPPDYSAQLTALQSETAALRAELTAEKAGGGPSLGVGTSGVSLSGFAQIDFALRQSSDDQVDAAGEPLNEDRLQLRRGRIRVAAEYPNVFGALEVDLSTRSGA